MSEVIKIGIRRGPGENSYSLMIGDSTAHDISMDEALGLIKEEMGKLREGEEELMEGGMRGVRKDVRACRGGRNRHMLGGVRPKADRPAG